jgi:hypothetical protein
VSHTDLDSIHTWNLELNSQARSQISEWQGVLAVRVEEFGRVLC